MYCCAPILTTIHINKGCTAGLVKLVLESLLQLQIYSVDCDMIVMGWLHGPDLHTLHLGGDAESTHNDSRV